METAIEGVQDEYDSRTQEAYNRMERLERIIDEIRLATNPATPDSKSYILIRKITTRTNRY